MIPVHQTKFEGKIGTGNCFQACMASLLHCSIEEVPELKESNTYEGKLALINRWLDKRGLAYLEIGPPQRYFFEVDFYYILSGPVEGEPPLGLNHAVVARKGRIVFDPVPGGKPITSDPKLLRIGFLIKKCTMPFVTGAVPATSAFKRIFRKISPR
jgi:hypothetical protein